MRFSFKKNQKRLLCKLEFKRHNKQYWREVKPLFSDKTKSNEKITLAEDETVTAQDEQNAELFDLFFSNAVKNLKIPRFSDTNPLAERLSDLKYKIY